MLTCASQIPTESTEGRPVGLKDHPTASITGSKAPPHPRPKNASVREPPLNSRIAGSTSISTHLPVSRLPNDGLQLEQVARESGERQHLLVSVPSDGSLQLERVAQEDGGERTQHDAAHGTSSITKSLGSKPPRPRPKQVVPSTQQALAGAASHVASSASFSQHPPATRPFGSSSQLRQAAQQSSGERAQHNGPEPARREQPTEDTHEVTDTIKRVARVYKATPKGVRGSSMQGEVLSSHLSFNLLNALAVQPVPQTWRMQHALRNLYQLHDRATFRKHATYLKIQLRMAKMQL